MELYSVKDRINWQSKLLLRFLVVLVQLSRNRHFVCKCSYVTLGVRHVNYFVMVPHFIVRFSISWLRMNVILSIGSLAAIQTSEFSQLVRGVGSVQPDVHHQIKSIYTYSPSNNYSARMGDLSSSWNHNLLRWYPMTLILWSSNDKIRGLSNNWD